MPLLGQFIFRCVQQNVVALGCNYVYIILKDFYDFKSHFSHGLK